MIWDRRQRATTSRSCSRNGSRPGAYRVNNPEQGCVGAAPQREGQHRERRTPGQCSNGEAEVLQQGLQGWAPLYKENKRAGGGEASTSPATPKIPLLTDAEARDIL